MMRHPFHARAFAALLLVAVVSAAAVAAEDHPHRPGRSVVIASRTRPVLPDPFGPADSAGSGAGQLVFNGLLSFNERWELVPDLAESWSVSEDLMTWTVRLKQGVLFHDGVELTAADVVFTYGQIIDGRRGLPVPGDLQFVDSVSADGPYTVIFALSAPHARFSNGMSQIVVPAHLYDETGVPVDGLTGAPVGTGPFVVSATEHGRLVLEANERFFGGRPHLDSVVFSYYPSRLAAWTGLLKGEVDVVEDVSPEDAEAIRESPNYRLYEFLDPFYYTVVFNTEDTLLRDRSVREAIDRAIDREDLIRVALDGAGEPALGPYLQGTWPGDALPTTDTRYNLAESRGLLDEHGWVDRNEDGIREKDGVELTVELIFDEGDESKRRVAARLKWQLLQAGIRVVATPVDLASFIQGRLIPGDYQAAILQFTTSVDPDHGLSRFWTSDMVGSRNISRYADAELDAYIRRGAEALTVQERVEEYRNVARILAEQRPAAFLFFRKRIFAATARLDMGLTKPASGPLFTTIPRWRMVE